MILTERRKQFLEKLIELFHKTNLPVHYETIANALGVSKWTAYDVLKELEKLGYLSRDYIVNSKEMGRSQIVFIPTDKAINLFEEKGLKEMDIDEWNKAKTKVFELLNSLKKLSLSEAVQKILEELPKVQVRVTRGAYIISLFIVCLRKLGGKTEALIKSIVQNAPTSETRIIIFIGTVLGSVIQTINHEIGVGVIELLGKYLKSFADLSDYEKGMLSDFLNDVLS